MTPSTKRAVIIVGSLLAAAIVLALALPAIGQLIQSTRTTQEDLPVEMTSLTLDGEVGDITVRAAGPDETPSLRATIRSGLTTPRVETVVSGTSVELSDTCNNSWWDNCSVTWDLVVPEATELAIVSSVGDVSVTETSGPLTVTSSVGSVTASGISAPTVQVRSSVGDVDLRFASPPQDVRATSSTGDVMVTVPGDGTDYRVITDSSVGSVSNEVGSDPGAHQAIEVRTSVGDITLRRG